jgi:hypothetical protein
VLPGLGVESVEGVSVVEMRADPVDMMAVVIGAGYAAYGDSNFHSIGAVLMVVDQKVELIIYRIPKES